MEKAYYVYLMASARYGYLYVGITSNLPRRMHEHQNNLIEGYSSKHQTHLLVYYEPHATAEAAIQREKQLKRYTRQWKFNLVDEFNPLWHDLTKTLNH